MATREMLCLLKFASFFSLSLRVCRVNSLCIHTKVLMKEIIFMEFIRIPDGPAFG